MYKNAEVKLGGCYNRLRSVQAELLQEGEEELCGGKN